MISIVLAAYNGCRYIEKQLDSIAAQSAPFDELLIRDDCSTDGTAQIIREWIQKNPHVPAKLLSSENNLGFIENFRLLLQQAKGDWIFLSDQDDVWHPDKLKTMLEIQKKEPKALLTGSSFRFMDAQGGLIEVSEHPQYSNHGLIPWKVEKGSLSSIGFDKVIQKNYFQGCSMMVHKSVVQKMLSIRDSRLPHDWQLAMCAAEIDGLYYLDQELFDYRIHEANSIGLPQTHKGLKEKLRFTLQEKTRRIVVQNMEDALETLSRCFPEKFLERQKLMLDFCIRYRKAFESRSLKDYLFLANHPARKECIPKNSGYMLGCAFLLLHPFGRGKERV